MKTLLMRFALAALVVGGLLLPLAAPHSEPASAADTGPCYILASVFSLGFAMGCPGAHNDPVDALTVSCSVLNPNVSATPDGNTNYYDYDLSCDQGTATIHASGIYVSDSGAVLEHLTTDLVDISVRWNCPHDPWIAPSAVACTRLTPVSLSHKEFTSSFDVTSFSPIPFGRPQPPISAEFFNDDQRLGLFQAQLRYAAAHPPAAAQVIVIPVSDSTSGSCLACTAVITPSGTPAPSPAPTLPDFKVTAVRASDPSQSFSNGMTAVYEVVLANVGTRAPTPVQVSIQMTGAVQYASMSQTPSGFDCSGSGPVTCVGAIGGYGDPIQNTVVTFKVRVYGAKAGIGAISAAADPNGLIKESDVTNNAKTLAITVK
jgi:hypothetical protein